MTTVRLLALVLLAAFPIFGEQAYAKNQPRAHGVHVTVPPAKVAVDDGDTITIRWSEKDVETVRMLGIDAPETRHLEHDIPYDQPWGAEARAFAVNAFHSATRIDLVRASTMDPYGRSLGYLFIDGRNYSLSIIRARLAAESVTPFGDNGFAKEASEVLAAAKEAGPLPIESPNSYRVRMRSLALWMKEHGQYPAK